MVHEAYEKIVPGAKVAVLFVHGICGSPNHFRQLLPMERAVPPEWSVCNIVLDGHCAEVEDFASSSMEKWKAQMDAIFDRLCRSHQKVIIVAHSMGTLFAMDLAIGRPEKVAYLFMLASPLYVWLQLPLFPNLLQLTMGKEEKWKPVVKAMKMATGMNITPKLWRYIPWIPRMLELLRECKATRARLCQLQVPGVVFQSEGDEVVSKRSRILLEKSGKLEVHNLMESTHYYYHPEDEKLVMEHFRRMIARLR